MLLCNEQMGNAEDFWRFCNHNMLLFSLFSWSIVGSRWFLVLTCWSAHLSNEESLENDVFKNKCLVNWSRFWIHISRAVARVQTLNTTQLMSGHEVRLPTWPLTQSFIDTNMQIIHVPILDCLCSQSLVDLSVRRMQVLIWKWDQSMPARELPSWKFRGQMVRVLQNTMLWSVYRLPGDHSVPWAIRKTLIVVYWTPCGSGLVW